jgi:hypothetical protein
MLLILLIGYCYLVPLAESLRAGDELKEFDRFSQAWSGRGRFAVNQG